MRSMTEADRPHVFRMMKDFFSTEFGRHCVWVEDLYLESELRGRGVATEFLDHLRTAYPDSVTRLESETDNDRAIRTYLKNGFEEIPYLEMIRR